MLTNTNLSAATLLDIGGGRQMIRMGMGLQDQRNGNAFALGGFNQGIGGTRIGLSAAMVPIQHGINHRALARCGVEDEVADGIGRLIKKRPDTGLMRCG